MRIVENFPPPPPKPPRTFNLMEVTEEEMSVLRDVIAEGRFQMSRMGRIDAFDAANRLYVLIRDAL